MTEKPREDASSAKHCDDRELWEFFVHTGLRGSHELRKELGLNEAIFRHVAAITHPEPRNFYLYRVLDEVQKAVMSIMQWREYLAEGPDSDRATDEDGSQLGRLAVEFVLDDQSFRVRKLSEVLVDSILFSTTNEQNYFLDYLCLHELHEVVRRQQDREEFFGYKNENARWQAVWLCDRLREIEGRGVDPKSRWYLTEHGPAKAEWADRRVRFTTFRQRYKDVLSIALPSELTVLGRSYVEAYGMSKDVHFTPHDTSSGFNEDKVHMGINKVGLLILALIVRCQLLMGCVPEGANKWYRDMHDSNTFPAALMEGFKSRPANVGDVVWVQGDLAEVIETKVSKYGYPAYRVKYLENPPLAEIPADWFAGFEVRLVTRRELIEQAADAAAEEIKKKTEGGEDFKVPDRDRLLQYAKQGVARLHRYAQQVRAAAIRNVASAETGSPEQQNGQQSAPPCSGAPRSPDGESRTSVEKP